MQPRWKEGCKGMLTVNAIFAGFSGTLFAILIKFNEASSCFYLFYLNSLLALCAFYLFALAAEKITDALDENKVETYIWSMLIYNFGVVCVLWSLAVFLWNQSYPKLALIPFTLCLYPWFYHIAWLLCCKLKRKEYKEDLLKTD